MITLCFNAIWSLLFKCLIFWYWKIQNKINAKKKDIVHGTWKKVYKKTSTSFRHFWYKWFLILELSLEESSCIDQQKISTCKYRAYKNFENTMKKTFKHNTHFRNNLSFWKWLIGIVIHRWKLRTLDIFKSPFSESPG